MSKSAEVMTARREAKFEEAGIRIIEKAYTETRKKGNEEYTLNFKFAVYRGKQLIGRTVRRRHALKRAHQWVRDNRR